MNSDEPSKEKKLHRSARINHKKEREKHTTDAELHIKNHPDQKSLSPVRICPLISATYGGHAQSGLIRSLICVHLVAEIERSGM